MGQVLIKGCQSCAMPYCQISQVMVGNIFRFARMRFQRWQVSRNPDRPAISGELVEQIPRFLHRGIDNFFIG
jgi:hypothetical protein